MVARFEDAARVTLAAGPVVLRLLAEEQRAERGGRRRFPDADGAGEDQAVREAVGAVRAAQRVDRAVLAEDVVECDHGATGGSVCSVAWASRPCALRRSRIML